MTGIDDQEVDGPDEAAGEDRRPQGEDGPTHDLPLRLGDDDTGLREIDKLAQEVRGSQRALATVHRTTIVTQGDDAVDVRDTGCSDLVLHADGSTSQGRRSTHLDRNSIEMQPRPAVPSSAANDLTLATR